MPPIPVTRFINLTLIPSPPEAEREAGLFVFKLLKE
jgi:hypothetical protein